MTSGTIIVLKYCKKMKYTTLLIFATLLLISCGNSKNAANSEKSDETENATPSAKKAILSQDIAKFRDTESYNIKSINLQGNILELNITYNGGCANHEFELVGSAFITKSLPPKRIVQLYHHKNTDDCRELVHETLYFDISDLAYQNSEIIISLQHFPESFRYTKVVEE
jgi:hypothetical protein